MVLVNNPHPRAKGPTPVDGDIIAVAGGGGGGAGVGGNVGGGGGGPSEEMVVMALVLAHMVEVELLCWWSWWT